MKKFAVLILISFFAGCGPSQHKYHFGIQSIEKYPVGKRTIRYSYEEPYLFLITRNKYEKEVNGYKFSHELTVVKLWEFDTLCVIKGTNIERFVYWKSVKDTIVGFLGDGIPDKGPALDHFKNIKMVKILPERGIVYDTLLYVINGKVGGARYMWLMNNGKKDFLLFDYDYRLHLIDVSTYKYLGHTREIGSFITPVYFEDGKLITSVVLGKLPGHRNDLYLEVFDVEKMRSKKVITVFEDSFRNVYNVVSFGSKNNFVFTAGDGMFAHHIYTFYGGKYKLVFSFPENTIPFITGAKVGKCGVFAVSLGHPSSFYSYRMMLGVLNKGNLVSIKEIPISSDVDFIYPPIFYSKNNKGILIFDIYNKEWDKDTLYIVKGSCLDFHH